MSSRQTSCTKFGSRIETGLNVPPELKKTTTRPTAVPVPTKSGSPSRSRSAVAVRERFPGTKNAGAGSPALGSPIPKSSHPSALTSPTPALLGGWFISCSERIWKPSDPLSADKSELAGRPDVRMPEHDESGMRPRHRAETLTIDEEVVDAVAIDVSRGRYGEAGAPIRLATDDHEPVRSIEQTEVERSRPGQSTAAEDDVADAFVLERHLAVRSPEDEVGNAVGIEVARCANSAADRSAVVSRFDRHAAARGVRRECDARGELGRRLRDSCDPRDGDGEGRKPAVEDDS